MSLRELCTVTLTFSRVKRSITLERYYLMAERENKSIKACARNIYIRAKSAVLGPLFPFPWPSGHSMIMWQCFNPLIP